MDYYFAIGFISIVVIGIMEAVKKFLPENTSTKIKSAISLAISFVFGVLLSVGEGIIFKFNAITIITITISVIGLTQTSYNFVFKFLNILLEKMKLNTSKELVDKVTDETANETAKN